MKFTDYQLQPFLQTALEKLSFSTPTKIQEKIIPLLLKGESVIGQSQTGSGKSHSFLLPLIHKINPDKQELQLVITVPSRELAEQLVRVTSQLIEEAPTPILLEKCVGGTDKLRQVQKLQQTAPHIVIGTPGRIFDLMRENALLVQTATMMVVDEADMTFDLGFLETVDEIASRMPKDLQMSVFSATIPDKIKPFLKKYLGNPKIIHVENKQLVSPTITNQLLVTKTQNPLEVLFELITLGHPYLMLIFVNTKQKADEVTTFLREKNLKVATIHGDIPARERRRVMKQIQQMEYQYVVATDLAARGIDIEGVSHVINLEIPSELEFFIHRVGRTGRNGLAGQAITFYTPNQEQAIQTLEAKGISFETLELKNGELVESYDRSRREKRKNTQSSDLDPRLKGMIKKAKKNVKPGYKKKLTQEIKQKQRIERKKQNRQSSRKKNSK